MLFLALGDFLSDSVYFHSAEIFYKQFAVKVIHFMLDADSQKILCLHFKFLAFGVLRADGDLLVSFYGIVNFGNREAAFFPLCCFAIISCDTRVDEYKWVFLLLLLEVDYDNLLVNIYLGGGKSYSTVFVHGVKHVFYKLLKRAVEVCHRLGYCTQSPVGILKYFSYGHS